MSSSNTNSDPEHTPSAPSFTFGGYISPNPKPIPLGVRLRPDPLIEYQTKNEHSPESQQPHKDKDASQKTQPTMQQQQQQQPKRVQTPAKVKVVRQAKQIQALQAQLDQMRLENEKLRSLSTSQSISPRDGANKHKG